VTIECELGFAPGCLTSARRTPAAGRYVGLNLLGASPLVTNAFAMIRLDPRRGAENCRQSDDPRRVSIRRILARQLFFGEGPRPEGRTGCHKRLRRARRADTGPEKPKPRSSGSGNGLSTHAGSGAISCVGVVRNRGGGQLWNRFGRQSQSRVVSAGTRGTAGARLLEIPEKNIEPPEQATEPLLLKKSTSASLVESSPWLWSYPCILGGISTSDEH
jgi:hypothetical protein